MHHHLQHGLSGDSDIFEVVWVFVPGPSVVQLSVGFFIVLVECVFLGVDEAGDIVEF